MKSFLARSSLILATLAIAAAACGDDSETSGPGGGTTASSTAATQSASSGTPTSTGAGGEGGGGEGVTIPDLTGPITATTDQLGVLHLACEEDDDCFAALGYFHAQNRFFFMDFVRNAVRGSLASLVAAGPIVLPTDYDNRRFFSTRDGEPLEEALYDQASDRVKGHLESYTRGVNAWIGDMRDERNGATLTTEYDFNLIRKEAIRDWVPEDSAAVGLYVMNDLSNNSEGELLLGDQLPAFGELGADLFSQVPLFEAYTSPLAVRIGEGTPIGGSVLARLASGRALFAAGAKQMQGLAAGRNKIRGEQGSNNWVVGPERSASGNALLANDPHLLLSNPSIWFPAEIDSKTNGNGDYHMAGGTFPGLPCVFTGHNESIGWGVTTAYWDLADNYVEELTPDGTAVIFEGEEVAIIEREYEFFDVQSGETETQTFRYVPHHGPIIEEDLDAGTAISVKWRGHDGGTDIDAFFAVNRAASLDEAREGIELVSSANQNFVVIDGAGDIGWYPYAKVPERPWAGPDLPPWLPLPGDGSAEWGEPVPAADLPQLTNPPGGVIATANQDMTGASADGDPTNDGQAAIQGWSKAEGARQRRILDLLDEGGDEHSPETMLDLQGDTYSLYGEIVVPALLDAIDGVELTPEEQAVVDALSAWDFTCPTGLASSDPEGDYDADAGVAAASIGCTAFHVALFAITEQALADDYAAAGVPFGGSTLAQVVVARSLRDPASLASGELIWDDLTTDFTETREITVRDGLTRAASVLADAGDPDDWRWGRFHTLSLRSIYDNFNVSDYNDGPYAAPGALSTVNVANPLSRVLPVDGTAPDFAFSAGPSIRTIIEASPDGPPVMTFQLPGGADLHRESDFYNNLLPTWLENEPSAFLFGEGAVDDPASVVVVSPE
jgi:penicillin amidase